MDRYDLMIVIAVVVCVLALFSMNLFLGHELKKMQEEEKNYFDSLCYLMVEDNDGNGIFGKQNCDILENVCGKGELDCEWINEGERGCKCKG